MDSRKVLIVALVAVSLSGAGLVLFMPKKVPATMASQSAAVASSASTTITPAATSSVQNSVSVPIHESNAPIPMNFEVVTTQAQQERGLGGRASIPDNYAMLFVFPNDGTPGFWMKDMLEPIDMISLADDGRIVSINKSVPVDSYPNVFYPTAPVRYVLETKAGFADEKGWHIGTIVALPLPY